MLTIEAREMQGSNNRVHVVVGVLFRPNGQIGFPQEVLWCQRPAGKPYAGYWEFPGGKMEPGETQWQALRRELDEELGLVLPVDPRGAMAPWFTLHHDYPHASVTLHFIRVLAYSGEPEPREGQQLAWLSLSKAVNELSPILPATLAVMPRLSLPAHIWLTAFETQGLSAFTSQLQHVMHQPFAFSQVMILFREKNLRGRDQVDALQTLISALSEYPCPPIMLVSSECAAAIEWLAHQNGNDFAFKFGSQLKWGLHWSERSWRTINSAEELGWPASLPLVCQTASIHDQRARELAESSGRFDALLLGTVKPSASHPGGVVLGWSGFEEVCAGNRLPIYAIGGLSSDDCREAWMHGAHGIAGRERAWLVS